MASKGFTLIELILSMGIFAILATMLTINFAGTQSRTLVAEAVDVLIADLRSQQAKAMVGSGESDYGVYFESDAYVMFVGSTYDSEDETNSRVELPGGVAITDNIWNGSMVVFERMSGEVVGYQESNDSLNITHGGSSQVRMIELNNYGVITSD